MNFRAFLLTPLSLGSCLLILTSCDNASERVAEAPAEKPAETTSAPPTADTKDGNSPLFSMGPEHEKAMKEREAAMEETNRRIEDLARQRNIAMVENQLDNLHANYLALYKEHIIDSFERNQTDLNAKHLAALQELQSKVPQSENSVLVTELEQEIQRATNGEPIPLPPPADNTANPGLEPIYSLRRWYHEGYANVTRARDATLLNLTNAYSKDLKTLKEQADTSLPDYAAAKVAQAVDDFDPGGWWSLPDKTLPAAP